MSAVSVRVEIVEISGERCDQLMSHILRYAFTGIIAKAEVISRDSDLIDVSRIEARVPEYLRGRVTSCYLVSAERLPELDGSTSGIVDL